MASFARTSFIAVLMCGLALLGYWRLTLDQQARTIEELKAASAQMQQVVAQRQAMIDRLSRSRRIAHVQVTDQKTDSSGAVLETSVLFIELDDQGAELARQSFTVPGDVLFVDAWTIKFDPERVAQGDPLMGKSLVLLRRIYSDRVPAKDGQLIDTPGAIPPGYAASDVGRFEKKLWENFWALATDPDKAREMGVRVAQGEAVYKPVRVGQTYELIADASGGMSLKPLGEGGVSLTKVDGS